MSKALDEIYCHSCGKPIKKEAEICIACGVRNKHAESHNKILLLLICLFFGCLGAHRFYVGKIGTGFLYLFTGGLLLIGAFIDLIRIATNKFEYK
ncbi:TM2 domain-containing protein [Borreliella bavariensis]|uniref:TM2 domain-containing protein n=1 Tax=Borreliella bavariensis TaxID=664662 RepID=UPI001C0007C5|nr:TM2 domain-containing protein [Borreliella bavariensis]